MAVVARIERLKRRHYVNVVTIVWQRERENERAWHEVRANFRSEGTKSWNCRYGPLWGRASSHHDGRRGWHLNFSGILKVNRRIDLDPFSKFHLTGRSDADEVLLKLAGLGIEWVKALWLAKTTCCDSRLRGLHFRRIVSVNYEETLRRTGEGLHPTNQPQCRKFRRCLAGKGSVGMKNSTKKNNIIHESETNFNNIDKLPEMFLS